ncbi:hypothetical protein PCASD_04329 [Puccinia coronata f. sp. avenae]|uniref:Uncharacterized protein n=1 Tax=Puccinia coronata f. sp. avenae TaxID=200324 RepID=A0A2N5VCU0_9BASI|nr:hypothetical protein PCASD_04329 [Puccinia coronata f. sp. avenae]
MARSRRHGYSSSCTPITQARHILTTQPTTLERAIAMALRHQFIQPSHLPAYKVQNPLRPDTEVHYEFDPEMNYEPPKPPHVNSLPPGLVTQYAIWQEKLAGAWKSVKNALTAVYFDLKASRAGTLRVYPILDTQNQPPKQYLSGIQDIHQGPGVQDKQWVLALGTKD